MSRGCSVDGCGGKHHAKGYCHSHSSRVYDALNRERRREITRAYYERNRRRMVERAARRYAETSDEINAARREKYATDPEFAQRERNRARANYAAQPKASSAEPGRKRQTHCGRGHPLDDAYVNAATGRRYCRTCRNLTKTTESGRSRIIRNRVRTISPEAVMREFETQDDYVENVRRLRAKYWDESGRKRESPLTDEELRSIE